MYTSLDINKLPEAQIKILINWLPVFLNQCFIFFLFGSQFLYSIVDLKFLFR